MNALELRTIQLLGIAVLIYLVVLPVKSQNFQYRYSSDFRQVQSAFDNGDFAKAIQLAGNVLEKRQVSIKKSARLQGLEIIAYSQISLGKLEEAEATVQEALQIISNSQVEPSQKAGIYFCATWLKRKQRQMSEAFDYAKKALSANPTDPQVQGEYYLNIGRILFWLDFDIAATIWLEKAEKILSQQNVKSPILLETYRFLSHVWSSKSNLHSALFYSEKYLSSVQKTQYRYRTR